MTTRISLSAKIHVPWGGGYKKDNEKKDTMVKNKHQFSLGNFSIKSKLIPTKS